MTLVFEIFALFSGNFFPQGPKHFFHITCYHFKYLGGALDIALHTRKQIMIIRGINQKLSWKNVVGGEKNGDFEAFFGKFPSPLAGESHMDK